MVKFLIIDAYDFEGYPTGGSGTLCDQLIKSFSNDVALIGLTTCNSDTIGNWCKKTINGVEYDYFPVKYVKRRFNSKSLVPARLKWFFALRKYQTDIVNYGCSSIFIQSPDTLLALYNWKFRNKCYCFAGLTSPLSMSRYKWARVLDGIFERIFIQKLKYANTFLAAASKKEIEAYCNKINKFGFSIEIIQFPTRVDTSVFFPYYWKRELRTKMHFVESSKIIVTSGRLSEVKGWRLLLDSFNLFHIDNPDSYFLIIGNGQDRVKIEAYISDLGLQRSVKLLGFLPKDKLAEYLNIADLYVMGSFFEGWPTSMVEAIISGIPICSTNFGSAKEIIWNRKLGIIVNERNPTSFAEGMETAIRIIHDEQIYKKEVEKYTTENLKNEVCKYWNF
jgi:glycosyltransferase involved in cell wall biosynthesis